MKIERADVLFDIVEDVQGRIGYIFSAQEVRKVLAYTKRKCEINGKGDSYVPILFENELRDYVMRAEINRLGEMNRCARFAEAALV